MVAACMTSRLLGECLLVGGTLPGGRPPWVAGMPHGEQQQCHSAVDASPPVPAVAGRPASHSQGTAGHEGHRPEHAGVMPAPMTRGLSGALSQVKSLLANWSDPGKPKAVFFLLARNSDLEGVKSSMQQLEQRFNAKVLGGAKSAGGGGAESWGRSTLAWLLRTVPAQLARFPRTVVRVLLSGPPPLSSSSGPGQCASSGRGGGR